MVDPVGFEHGIVVGFGPVLGDELDAVFVPLGDR